MKRYIAVFFIYKSFPLQTDIIHIFIGMRGNGDLPVQVPSLGNERHPLLIGKVIIFTPVIDHPCR